MDIAKSKSKSIKTDKTTKKKRKIVYVSPKPEPDINFKRYPNLDVQCTGWGDRIDMYVCITRSMRHPDRCRECPANL
jgi:hypothetical protein